MIVLSILTVNLLKFQLFLDFDDVFDFEIINYYYYEWIISEFSHFITNLYFLFYDFEPLTILLFRLSEVTAKN